MKPETIIQIINRDFGVDIKSKNRKENYVFARELYCALAVELFYPHWNYSDIAKSVERNHATILHAIRKPKDRLFKKTYEKYLIGFSQNLIELPDDGNTDRVISRYQRRNDFLENEIVSLKLKLQDLEETALKNKKEKFLNKLNKFDKHKREELKKRFELIMDMESRKIYNFRDTLQAV